MLQSVREEVLSGRRRPEPLVLHVSVGDCVSVELSNEITDGPVSFHADLLAADPSDSAGVAAGREPPQAVPPGVKRTFTYYASPEVGETVALVRDWGDVLRNPGRGLYGAVVVGPRGATYRGSGWAVDVFPPDRPPYRDFTLFFQDEDEALGSHRMPYSTDVRGTVAINYDAAPLNLRQAANPDRAKTFDVASHGDPPTPVMRAYAGDPVRLHVLAPWSEQAQVFSVEGHQWPTTPGLPGTALVSSQQLLGLEALTMDLHGGAGGPDRVPGDYLYGDHREPYRQAGLWGLLRVIPSDGQSSAELEPLVRPSGKDAARVALVAVLCTALLAVLAFVAVHRRRK